MSSPLLALLVRSLREDARGKLTCTARAGLVLVVAVFMVLTVLTTGWGGAPGLQFFQAIAFIQMAFITLAGCSYFASAITEEKEEQTLGLLRMTNLDPLSILLGKSTSRLCGALLLLAAQIPFTLLAVTLGGITSRQVFAAYLALGAYAFLLCNLALLASVVARRTGGAGLLVAVPLVTLGLFAKLIFAPARVRLSPAWSEWNGLWNSAAGALLPLDRMEAIFSTTFAGPLIDRQFWSSIVAGLACFFGAWLLFERCCAGEPGGETGILRESARRRFPPGRVWRRAIVWKDFHFIHGGRFVAGAKYLGYPLLLFATFFFHFDSFSIPETVTECGTFLVWVAGSIFTFELGFAASRLFRVETRDRTWSSLALLPLSADALHRVKLAACYQALFPSVLTVAIGMLIAFCGSVMTSQSGEEVVAVMLLSLVFVGMHCVLFFYLVAWLSLFLPRGALPLGIALIFLFDLLGGLLGLATLGLGFLALPFVPLIAARVFRTRLLERLEQLAAEE
ncbi:MAG: hypothetical protein QOE70_5972 [Chthoniobacter sp.]|jgi:hypothetical protein|nr:hypothetical protein [Chthoniobacter sp.]